MAKFEDVANAFVMAFIQRASACHLSTIWQKSLTLAG